MFLPHFDVICDLLLNRRTETWNLFALYNKELSFIRIKADGDVNRASVLFLSIYRNTSESLGEREMLWEHEPQASVSTAFSSSPKLSLVFL